MIILLLFLGELDGIEKVSYTEGDNSLSDILPLFKLGLSHNNDTSFTHKIVAKFLYNSSLPELGISSLRNTHCPRKRGRRLCLISLLELVS